MRKKQGLVKVQAQNVPYFVVKGRGTSSNFLFYELHLQHRQREMN